MKKFKILSLLLVTAAAALTSCNNSGPKKEELKPGIVEGDALIYDRAAYRSSYRGLRTLGAGYTTESFTRVKSETGSYDCITNIGTLIVGVDFTDYPASSMPKGEQGTLKDLNDAVLGNSEDTAWESLKSYYYKTSYGICNINGVVAPEFYHTNVNVTQFAKGEATDGSSGENATKVLCKKVTEWARDTLHMDTKQFDGNGDGFIDSVIMIYTAPFHVKDSKGNAVNDDLFWAFCWSRNASTSESNIDNPAPYRFFWASYKTFYEDGYYDEHNQYKDWTDEQIANGTAKLDAHTLIHEFGHALSLPDYYNGNYNSSDPNAYDPLGALDMMAYNVGDHNAFSKALYGWIAPYLVYGNTTINLRSTTDTGDFIVIPVNELDDPTRDFTLLSQYIMIEFLTPTGVALADSLDAYIGYYPVWYSTPGIRVTLVDARMGMFVYSSQAQSYVFNGFTASTSAPSGGYTSFACDNNDIGRSCFSTYKLIEIVPANGIKAKNLANGRADNDCLYKEGSEFNTGNRNAVWNDFKADGKGGQRNVDFNFGFTVTKMTNDMCQIQIVKK